jgi:uncharacterized protein YecE (DUF72 family)
MIRIGISGWTYRARRGPFFPPGLPSAKSLAFAGRQFSTIEINGTFYRLQTPSSFQRWHDDMPAGFVFAVKGGRFITHTKRLGDVREPLANFFASGLLALDDKLGPILWQLPASLHYDPDRIADFLACLPRDTVTAAKLARGHGPALPARAFLKPGEHRPILHALEVRHRSFARPEFIALLRRENIALVISDAPGWPRLDDVTAIFSISACMARPSFMPAVMMRRPSRIGLGGFAAGRKAPRPGTRSASPRPHAGVGGTSMSISTMMPRFERRPMRRRSCSTSALPRRTG